MASTEDAAVVDEQALGLGQKKAFIFDMDGVIIDSEPLHERASRLVFAHFKLDYDESNFSAFKGQTDRAIVTHILSENGSLDFGVDEVLEMKRQTYAGLIDELQPIHGVISFLHRIEGAFRLALTTSASRRNKELAFQKFHLHSFFEVVITSNDISKPKPDPEPYVVTTERLKLAPAECVVIEDSTNGVMSAVGAGCTVVGITTSFDRAALLKAGAHVVIDSYEQLAELI